MILKEGRYFRFSRRGDWEFFSRKNCSDVAIIVALTDEGKVIFVEQYREPVRKKVIEFPAGLINDHTPETFAQGAKRELLEETGYRARRITRLLKGPAQSGASADLVTMVRAYGLKKVSAGGGDRSEKIKVHEVILTEVPAWLKKMSRRGYLIEPKVYAGLYFLTA
ncbi:MAG: NUDIX hydrolase [Candidatus Omnitrophica bacterium]|nr:NUDIX hydrolase [Candidatus Omnitrophota bacterium]